MEVELKLFTNKIKFINKNIKKEIFDISSLFVALYYHKIAFFSRLVINIKQVYNNQRWKNGNSIPEYSIFNILCNTLDVSINELYYGKKMEKEDYFQSIR